MFVKLQLVVQSNLVFLQMQIIFARLQICYKQTETIRLQSVVDSCWDLDTSVSLIRNNKEISWVWRTSCESPVHSFSSLLSCLLTELQCIEASADHFVSVCCVVSRRYESDDGVVDENGEDSASGVMIRRSVRFDVWDIWPPRASHSSSTCWIYGILKQAEHSYWVRDCLSILACWLCSRIVISDPSAGFSSFWYFVFCTRWARSDSYSLFAQIMKTIKLKWILSLHTINIRW